MAAPAAMAGSHVLRRRLSGVAFLVVIGLLVYLTVLLYNKAFTKVVTVSLKTDHVGNQLSAPADVKLRGVLVGEVRDVRSKGQGATIELALKPERVKDIPANVQAQLLPKTLFGEKYVLLVLPPVPSAEPIKDGDVIPQDRSRTALETERVLDDLMPLLQSLKPQQLSTTLNALSTALRDRGDRLGNNLATAGRYFDSINPSLPTLAQDMQGLADLADTTADATPDLLRVLDNLSFSSRSLVDQQDELDRFLSATTTFAASAQSIVAQNEQRLVALSRDSLPSLQLYARYSPEFPCFFAGLAKYSPIVERTFGGGQPGLHITVEVTTDRGTYTPGQEPKYRDARPPYCDGLPSPRVPAPDARFDDGYQSDTTPSTQQEAAVKAVAAPVLGVPFDQVPDLVTMLFGPLAGGSTVGLA